MKQFPKKIFTTTVRESELVAQGVKKLTLQPAEDFSFTPGQYVWVEIPTLKIGDPAGNRKAFSICSLPNSQNTFSVVARESASGFKKAWFALSPGDTVITHGPFGSSFGIHEHFPKNIVMIAGGVGVAPFLPVIELIQKRALPIRCILIYLDKTEESTPFLSELEQLQNTNSFFEYRAVYDYFSWGYIKTKYENLTGATEWWVSGSQKMVEYVYAELSKGGVAREHMVFENYYPSSKDNLNIEQVREQMQKEGLLTQAIQNSTNHTIITDSNGIVLFANKAAEKITGYSQAEILGNTPRLWGGMMDPAFYKDFWQKKRSGQSFEGEMTNRRKNGELYHTIAHIAPIFGTSKEIIGFIGTEEDVTSLKKQEEKILQDKLKDEAILSSIGESVIATDNTGKVVFANQTALDLFEQPEEIVFNKKIWDILILVDAKGGLITEASRPMKLALTTGKKIITSEYCFYNENNKKKIVVAITATPVILDGSIIGAIEIIRDITKEKEIDQAKTEFVSLASHQLRTPLSAINWYTEMLLAGDAGKLNDEQEKYLKEVYTGNQRMVELVNALLNVSRLDLGTFVIEPKPTDVLALAKSVLGELQPLITQKQLTVTEHFSQGIPQFNADEKLLRMVFQNLLSNSVKYTLLKGSVTADVTVVSKDEMFGGKKVAVDSLAICVSDSGMGIPTAQHAKIFSKLFRADNAMETEAEGTGLGLYIVKSIVDQSGGKIWFKSEQDKGTEFYVLFPITGMKSKDGLKKLE